MRVQCVLSAVALLVGLCGVAAAEDEQRPYLDIPIHQSVNRGGAIRYAIWVKVGDRTVEALLDTGSTGLRVLASVVPGEITSTVSVDAGFGGTLHMKGPIVRAPIEIGSMKGEALVEIIQEAGCVADKPDCGAEPVDSDSFRIGGDSFAHQGYSAIIGIGLPFIPDVIGNPLEAVGAKRWIVDLPRPYDALPGHLILDPDAATSSGFTLLPRTGQADADGCIEGDFLPAKKCGTVLFDTGAPEVAVSYEGLKTGSMWSDHATGAITLLLDDDKTLKLDVKAGANGGLRRVSISPAGHDQPKPFIQAGVSPFFAYDMLYDNAAHNVALKARSPVALVEQARQVAPEDQPAAGRTVRRHERPREASIDSGWVYRRDDGRGMFDLPSNEAR